MNATFKMPRRCALLLCATILTGCLGPSEKAMPHDGSEGGSKMNAEAEAIARTMTEWMTPCKRENRGGHSRPRRQI